MKCERCLNTDEALFFYDQGQWVCRVCLDFTGRQVDKKVQSSQSVIYSPPFELTLAQRKVADQLIAWQDQSEILVDVVCGGGKTALCYPLIYEALKAGKTIGWMVPRRQVVLQIFDQLQHVFPNQKVICVAQGYTDQLEGEIVVLTAHQLYRYPNYFDVLILDEVDAYPYANHSVLQGFAEVACKGQKIYLTATPSPTEKQIACQVILHERAHQRPLVIPTCFYVLKRLERGLLYLLVWKLRSQSTLIFVPTIHDAKVISKWLRCPYISSETKTDQVIENFRDKKLLRLVSTTVLERGVTFEGVHVIVFEANHPVYDEASLIQISGRVDRSYHHLGGKCYFLASQYSREIKQCIKTLKKHNRLARGA